MIPNPEYSDLYRFLTSSGIILIILGFILFFYSYNSAFDISKDFLTNYSPETLRNNGYSNETISQLDDLYSGKMRFHIILLKVVPPFAILLVIAGVICFLIGFIRWLEKQTDIDEVEKLANRSSKANYENQLGLHSEKVLENRLYLRGIKKIK